MTEAPHRMQALLKKTKTVCFGRFVIDIPATASLAFGPAEVGPYISFLPGEAKKIPKYVDKDLVEIEKSRRFLDKTDAARLPLFGQVHDGIISGQKITFDSKSGVGYYVNSFIPVGDDLFVLHYSSVLHERYNVEVFNTIARKLRSRADEKIPSGAGSCIDGGFLPMALEYERIRLGIRLLEYPDVHLSIDVHKNLDTLEESGRLELMLTAGEKSAKQFGHGAAYARIKTFRRGPRQLGPWKGFEMVARKPAYLDDTEAHEFRFHSLGAVHDPLLPQLDIRLDTGVKDNRTASTKPTLSDEEAIALWDRLIETIRVRQTSTPTPGKNFDKKIALGSLATTGEICMQGGVWRYTQPDNIEGGRQRHFKTGETMPHAVLLEEPSAWQKLTGNRTKHTVTAVWKLVAYDDVPADPPSIAK